MKVVLCAVAAAASLMATATSAGFMISPLSYSQGVYTPQIITSVLDHSMKQATPGGPWQYGKFTDGGGDGIIEAFNGETVRGPRSNDPTCVSPQIRLLPYFGAPASAGLVNPSGCNGTLTLSKYVYTSYDEHPGYDYVAPLNTPVYAVAYGTVVNYGGDRCIKTYLWPDACASWGWIGIDHGNGYISQYGHLSWVAMNLVPGKTVLQGQLIGFSGKTIPSNRGSVGAHLHFEVLWKSRTSYTPCGGQICIVDPYGWVGPGTDPLYSARYVAPAKLWK